MRQQTADRPPNSFEVLRHQLHWGQQTSIDAADEETSWAPPERYSGPQKAQLQPAAEPPMSGAPEKAEEERQAEERQAGELELCSNAEQPIHTENRLWENCW